MALSRRNPQKRLEEPLYEIQDVPPCCRQLEESDLIRIEDRGLWMKMLPELLLLCNEASARFDDRCKSMVDEIKAATPQGQAPVIPPDLHSVHDGKALGLEYITDRIDLDDPLHGYVVRTKNEGWIQGFITVTTFTSWQRWFRWDTLADQAGVLEFDCDGAGMDSLHSIGHPDPREVDKPELSWWLNRTVDADGSLSAALNSEIRDGDPDGEGVIWPHVAELSLLGGIGCGSFLVNLIIEELESGDSPYNFIVLQATENAVSFYEKHGFVRVGAVARYFDKNATKESESASNDEVNGAVPLVVEEVGVNKAESSDSVAGENNAENTLEDGTKVNVLRTRRRCSPDIASTPSQPTTTENIKGSSPSGPIAEAVSSMISNAKNLFFPPNHESNKRQPEPRRRCRAPSSNSKPRTPPPLDTVDMNSSSDSSGSRELNGASSNFFWHQVNEKETPTLQDLAKKFNIQAGDIAFMNRRMYGELSPDDQLLDGVKLRIPAFPSFFDGYNHALKFECTTAKAVDTRPLVTCAAGPGEVSPNGLWYCAKDNQTPRQIAQSLGIHFKELISANAKLYPDLTSWSPLMESTILRLPNINAQPLGVSDPTLTDELHSARSSWGWGSDDANQVGLSDVMTYRHWAFSDDPVDFSVASYMMVRPLKKRPKSVQKDEKGKVSVTSGGKAKSQTAITTYSTTPKVGFSAEDSQSPIAELSRKRFAGTDFVPPQFSYELSCSPNDNSTEDKDEPQTNDLAEQNSHMEVSVKEDPDGGLDIASIDQHENNNHSGYPREVRVIIRCASIRRMRQQDSAHRMGPLEAAVTFVEDVTKANKGSGKRKRGRSGSDLSAKSNRSSNTSQQEDDGGLASYEMKSKRFMAMRDLSSLKKVYVRNSIIVGPRLTARIETPLNVKYSNQSSSQISKPRPPWNAYMCFSMSRRSQLKKNQPELDFSSASTLFAQEWKNLSDTKKKKFIQMAEDEKARYTQEMEEYQSLHADGLASSIAADFDQKGSTLVNQVIRLKKKSSNGARTKFLNLAPRLGGTDGVTKNPDPVAVLEAARLVEETSRTEPLFESHLTAMRFCAKKKDRGEEDAEFYFVLTYIPDLFWCRLCPLHRVGEFDKSFPRHMGRTKWMLVPEGEAVEIDVSASRCEPVPSVAVKRTQDADQEEWDILI